MPSQRTTPRGPKFGSPRLWRGCPFVLAALACHHTAFCQSDRSLVPRETLTHVLTQEHPPTPVPPPAPRSENGPTPVPRSRLPAGWEFAQFRTPLPTPTPEALPATNGSGDVVVLDKMVVQGEKDTFVPDKLGEIQERRARATYDIESIDDSPLDQVLNNPLFAFLGPYSTATRTAMAQAKLDALETEEALLLAIDATTDPAERAMLKRYYIELRYGVKMSK